jgi:hypothetical protein
MGKRRAGEKGHAPAARTAQPLGVPSPSVELDPPPEPDPEVDVDVDVELPEPDLVPLDPSREPEPSCEPPSVRTASVTGTSDPLRSPCSRVAPAIVPDGPPEPSL